MAIRVVAELGDPRVKLHICGEGTETQERMYRELALACGVENQCIWHGKVEHENIIGMMRQCDLFLFTSIMEATSTVVLEAITAGLPVLSFNTCGFGPLVKDFAGEAIELSNPEQSIKDFAEKIKFFIAHPEALATIRESEFANLEKLSWDSKARQVVEIYQKLDNTKRNYLC